MRRDAWLITPGRVPYGVAFDRMRALAARRVAGEIPDTFILLEHPPVYTAGRRTRPEHLLVTEQEIRRRGAELHHVDRGGSLTFHGPGQLVGYAVVHLGVGPAVAQHVWRLQEVVIRAAAELGVDLGRDEEVGVWAGSRKVAAIGVKTTRRVTYHGFALNCSTEPSWWDAIVPCGLADRSVTSLTELLGRPVTMADVLPGAARAFGDVFGVRPTPAPAAVAAAFGASDPALAAG
jgi:lipoyl(octanoyl) transferase